MVIFLPEYAFALIVTLHFKDFPSLKCAVTVVVPIFLPVIFPFLFTEATEELLEVQEVATPLFTLSVLTNPLVMDNLLLLKLTLFESCTILASNLVS